MRIMRNLAIGALGYGAYKAWRARQRSPNRTQPPRGAM